MKQSTRFKVLWTVWMSGGGIATGAIVYVVTGSLGWALAIGRASDAVGCRSVTSGCIISRCRGDGVATRSARPPRHVLQRTAGPRPP